MARGPPAGDRYDCTVHALPGMTYFTGTNPRTGEVYFEADNELDADGPLPLDGASLYLFGSDPPEGLLRLDVGGGTLVSGDSLQNWFGRPPYFGPVALVGMWALGFLRPTQLGPGWLQYTKPDPASVGGVLDLDFANVIPSHGAPVIGNAKERYRSAIEAYARSGG